MDSKENDYARHVTDEKNFNSEENMPRPTLKRADDTQLQNELQQLDVLNSSIQSEDKKADDQKQQNGVISTFSEQDVHYPLKNNVAIEETVSPSKSQNPSSAHVQSNGHVTGGGVTAQSDDDER